MAIIRSGFLFSRIVSFVIVHFSISGFDGISNIISLIISSIIERNPLAPVFLSIALSTIASNASFVNSRFTPSISNSFLYCFTSEFFGSVTIFTKASLSKSFRLAIIGSLPINSGISPNFNKSCGNSSLNISYLFVSFLLSIFVPNPIFFSPVLSFIISSNPSKAPPQINKIFYVFICNSS